MTNLRDQIRAVIVAALRCPKCPATNRPGATIIELDQTGTRAYCGVCSREGKLEDFQQEN